MNETGVMIIGHGSSNAAWVELVDQAVTNLECSVPFTTCFLEMVEGRLIADGIRELEEQGVQKIVAIPLFVAAGSTHIDEIAYMLGASEHKLDEKWKRLSHEAKIAFCPPMEDHPLIIDILEERIKELSVDPEKEVLLVIGHGADEGDNYQKWEELLSSVTNKLNQRFGFVHAGYGTLHPNNLRERALSASKQGTTIVIPLFLSEGYFTNKVIPAKLEGLDYVYSGKTYLPHPYVSRWLQQVIDHHCEPNDLSSVG
ncbi:sirohydrochlorin chelatase [Brevibacillus daliensis]|uniref:sirohydrochlorin chelatase n=1 Tax=Brevibacillus daliensis TaxID=2892995 RepID=UPI001E636D82|nr:CbiX/SirB N-terminal domain-containing protein [Brevibacillus daliensis]